MVLNNAGRTLCVYKRDANGGSLTMTTVANYPQLT